MSELVRRLLRGSLAGSPLVLVVVLVIAARAEESPPDPGDPTKGEVALPAANGWSGFLVRRNEDGAGIWTVRALQVFARYACPELVALDDRGRCTVLVSYSGKWTPFFTVEDREWLGAIALADLDPRDGAREVYTGGKSGRLYRIASRRTAGFDTRVVAEFPGEEIHTLVSADLVTSRPGHEVLVFLRSGGLYELRAEGAELVAARLATLPGRVRDALVLPGPGGARVVTASRAGVVSLLRLTDSGVSREPILREPMGFGRLALAPRDAGEPAVLYVTRDDGLVLRLEEGDGWQREVVYAGPQGPRGVVAGRFHADPDMETIAVFGYSRRVELLSRRRGERGFRVETIFEDLDRGHWLEAAEVDGRNATQEIVGSGYAGRVFLLARPPGYGMGDVAVDPAAASDEPSRETK